MKASERISELESRLTNREAQCGQLIGERDNLRRQVEELKRRAEAATNHEAAIWRLEALVDRMGNEIDWLRSAVAPGRAEKT